MIQKEWALDFAKKWIDAFNSHDLDLIFSLYEDDFKMTSPYIIEKMGKESGTLYGKNQVEPYWQKAIGPNSTLEFELVDVFNGVDTVVVYYKSLGRNMVCETFTFNSGGKITSGCSQHGRALVE